MAQPGLLYYKDTPQWDFPLLLIVSRQSNGDETLVPEAGSYDFDESRSGLWNSAYGLLAWANGLETGELKAMCRERGASPLVFAECSPVAIPAGAGKGASRPGVTAEEARRHVEGVLANEELIGRATLAIFGGVDAGEFHAARSVYQEGLLNRGIPWFPTRHLFGNNMRAIKEEIPEPGRVRLQDIHRRFERARDLLNSLIEVD